MTAAMAPAPSKAAKFADAAEALGWHVERLRLEGGARAVVATRNGEQFEAEWKPGARGLVLAACWHYADAEDAEGEPVSGPTEALRLMALHRAANGSRLPFSPEDSTDLEVLAAVVGKTITWRTQYGTEESGTVPRGGMHLRLTQGPKGDNGGARILNFADPLVTGFRAVYIDSITKVQ